MKSISGAGLPKEAKYFLCSDIAHRHIYLPLTGPAGFCYLSIFCNRILHITAAKAKIKNSGKRLSNLNTLSAISLYPHVAGNNFPTVSNAFGSSSVGNIIPESMIDGKKTIIENIEVFAWSFTARPIMLAMPSDTAIKIARLMKCLPGFSGISASKASGAAIYKIMLIMNK